MPRGSLASILALLGVAVPAFYSMYWTVERSATDMTGYLDGQKPAPDRMHDVDCRASVGAHFGERAKPLYLDFPDFMDISGCRPMYQVGDKKTSWPVRIVAVADPLPQLRGLDELVRRDEALDALCRPAGTPVDVVCERALRNRPACHPEGRYLRCPLYPADRAALLGRGPRAP